MARLRFPGRPGCRFDRLGVRYGADEARNTNDPLTLFVANIHRGLRLFRELVGDSDEDDEFEGFTKEEVRLSEKKLQKELAKYKRDDEGDISSPVSPKFGTRLSKRRESLENLPSAECTRNRKSTLIRKSYKEMINQGLATPSKSYIIKKAKDSASARSEVHKEMKKWQKNRKSTETSQEKAPKKFKIRLDPHGKVRKIGNKKGRPSKSDESNSDDYDKPLKVDEKEEMGASEKGKKKVKEKDKFSAVGKAKQLLQKAKTCKKDKVSPEQTKKKVSARKQFVLPVLSSRSSRVIIPNKRFIEEDSENLGKSFAKRPALKTDQSLKPAVVEPKLLPETGLFANASTKLQIETEKLPSLPISSLSPSGIVKPKFEALTGIGGFPSPLYDQPLIVEGKRARKPSLKVRMKMSDSSYKKFKERSLEKKLEARKILEQEKVKQKEQDYAHEGKKLFLSPSKLGATLTPKLPTIPIMAPPKFGVAPFSSISERERLEKLEREALVKRMRGHNILRKAKFQLNRAALNRSKADLARTLKKELKMEAKLQKIQESHKNKLVSTASGVRLEQDVGDDGSVNKVFHCCICDRGMAAPRKRSGVITCESCRRFFQIHTEKINQNQALTCTTRSCKIYYKEKPYCEDCRYNKCLKFFNLGDRKAQTSSDQIAGSNDLTKEIHVTIPQITVSSASPGTSAPMSSPFGSLKSPSSLLSPMAASSPPVTTTTSSPETDDSPKSDGRGPRIKHVCRKAAVVLGKPVAKFPKSPEITLSALPSGEKVKLWKKDQEDKKELSDDELPLEDIIQQSEDNFQSVKKTPVRSPLKVYRGGRYGKRKIRCKKCEGCTSEDCGVCNYCLDKPKFGGRGVMKQACIKRRCKYPRYSRLAPGTLMRPRDSDNQSEGSASSPCKDTSSPGPVQQGRSQNDPSKGTSSRNSSLSVIQRMALQGKRLLNANKLNNDKSSRPFSEVLTPEDVSRRLWQEFGHAPQVSFPKFQSSSFGEGIKSQNSTQPKRMITKFKGSEGKSDTMIMHSVTTAGGWSAQGIAQHRIKAEYRENFELTSVWYSGVSLTISGPMCVRVICFLCGSAGKHEMLYCNVCCEPFHEFCLEEEERPHEINPVNWCCKRCQFCNVCGRQNNLLQCDKCQNTYHPECLGPNYPTKPSKKKNIWICTKCVKCKSCGATTPGSGSAATWTYDFQLCYECGQLMDKGNYCPICHKCYTDDDWDSKMVQCVSCESWVHAKCEGLSDEMYERVSVLPEDVHYICKICSPKGPRHWELVLKDSFMDGLKSVFNTVTQAKCAQHLLHIDEKKVKELEDKLNEQKYGSALKTTIELEKSLENFVNSLEKVLKSKNKAGAIEQQQTEEKNTEKGPSVVELVDGDKKDEKPSEDNDKDDSLIRFEGDEDLDETKSSMDGEQQSDVEMAEVLNDSDTISIADGETLSAVTTPGVSRGVTPAGSPEAGEEGIEELPPPPQVSGDLAQKLGDVVDASAEDRIMENIPKITLLLGEEKDEVDGSKKENCEAIVSTVDNKEREQSTSVDVEMEDKMESHSNVCDTDNSANCPKLPSDDQSINLLDKEIKQEQIEENSQRNSCEGQSSAKTSDEVVDLTVEKSVSFLLSTPTKGLITPKKCSMTDNRFLPGFIRSYPKDFNAVKIKLINEEYSSVNEFSGDMAHIINLALNDPDELKLVRKKATNSVRSMFVKQMEKCFPWFNVKACQIWDQNQNFPPGMLPEAVLPPFEDHTYAQWLEREELHRSPQPSPFKRVGNTPIKKIIPLPVDEDAEKVLSCDLEESGEDIRRCILCWHYGDSDPNDAGRLLYVGQDDWVHVNCALWSAEVYEEEHDGTLQNVQTALSRGRVMRCDSCQRAGATVGCCTRGCPANYHFMCARQELCLFQEDKKVFCPQHREKVDGELVAKEKFAVNRRVCVSMEDLKFNKKTWSKGLDPSNISVIIGSCTVEELGRLSPISDTKDLLFPIEFSCTRVFWSTQDIRKRCVYTCQIVEVKPDSPKGASMVIKDTTIIHDETHPDYVPLSQINLPGINLFPEKRSRTESLEISHLSSESGFSRSLDSSGDCEILNSTMNISQNITDFDTSKDSLSSSWPIVRKRKKSDSCVNLGVLSPNTLKLLNLKDPEKFQQASKPCKQDKEDFETLIKIADRLNMAAVGKTDKAKGFTQRQRSRSVDRLLSPPPVRFSPSFRSEGHQSAGNSRSNSRANSEERTFSPIPTMSLEKQLAMNKEVTSMKPLIDSNCNSQVTDLNNADVAGSPQGPEGGLEPINEEGIPDGDLSNETYVVLPEGCSELSDEDMQMIAEAIERSRSEQATDESMMSVESTEEPSGEVDKKKSEIDVGTEVSTAEAGSTAEADSSSKEVQQDLSCTIDSERVVDEALEGMQIDSTSEKEEMNVELAMDIRESIENGNQIDSTACSDSKGLDSELFVKTDILPTATIKEMGCDKTELVNQVKETQKQMDISKDSESKQSTLSDVDTADEGTNITSEHEVKEHSTSSIFNEESGSLEVEEKVPEADSQTCPTDICEASTEKMETEMAVDISKESEVVSSLAPISKEMCSTKVPSENLDKVGTQNSDESLIAGANAPLTSPSLLHSEQQRPVENVFSGTAKSDKKIPVYCREGQLIGYRTPNKSMLEHQELRRLHLTTRKPTFEEILNEAQKQLQEQENKTDTKMEAKENKTDINKYQPLESTEKSFVQASVGSFNDKQGDDLHVSTEHQPETVESKTEDALSNSLSSERNIFDIMSANKEEPKIASPKLTVAIETNTNQDTEEKETEIQKENMDGISGSKDSSENEKQITSRRQSSESDKDRNIFSALESSFNSSKGLDSSDIDVESVQDDHIPDTRTEEEKNNLFKGLGLARTPEARKTKELKKTPIKSYPLRRRSAQGGAGSEDKRSDLPLHDQIAQKIKAESLAKSSPGDKGPFKCPTCKRLYRTVESFDTHVETCDFEVSTSDEEEESENEGGTRKYSMRQTTVVKKVVMEIEQKERESESAARKEKILSTKPLHKKPRLVLHKLSPRKLQQGNTNLSPRKRGRPPKTESKDISVKSELKGQKRLLSSDDEKSGTENERKRRLSRHSSGGSVSTVRHSRSLSGGVKLVEDVKVENDDDASSPKRGRGRPRKSLVSPSDEKKQEEKSVVKEQSQSEESDLNRSISPKRGRGRPRKSSLLTEEDIKQEIITSDELNSQDESLSENSPKSTRGRGRPKKNSVVLEDTSSSSKNQMRITRRASGDHVCSESSTISPKTQKRSQGRPSSGSTKKEELSGRLRKGLVKHSGTQRRETRLKDRTASITDGRPVRLKKKVNLEYPGLSSLASKRNAILSRKIHSLRDSRIKQQKLKQVISMQGKKLERIVKENGVKRGRGRPRKYEAEKSRKSEDVQSKGKKNDRVKSDTQEKKDSSENEKKELKDAKESKMSDKDEKSNKRENLKETKETPSKDMNTESNKKQVTKCQKRKSKTGIENAILNVIQQSNTSTLLKCPVQQVPSISDSEVITITDETSEDEVIFCEKTGDFLSKGRKNAAKSCETQCDFDSDMSPLKSDISVVSTSSNLQISSTSKDVQAGNQRSPSKSETVRETSSSTKDVQAGNQRSPSKSETVRETSSSTKEMLPKCIHASLSSKQNDAIEPEKSADTNVVEKASGIHSNEGKKTSTENVGKETSTENLKKETSTENLGKETSTENFGKETPTENLGKETSTEKFVDQIMNNPAIKQLTPVELLELQNKVTDEKVDLSTPSKVDTEATIKTIKEFLKKKIEEGTNKTMYVTDAGNVESQGQSSSEQKSFSEPVSVMKINLPSSVTPHDIKKIIEAHKRATGTLGKSESSIGITPISRSSPLQSLMSQSTTSILSSTSTSPQFSQAQSQQSNPTVQTSMIPPNPVIPQSFGVTATHMSAANALLAAANAISPSSNPILPSPSPMMPPPNAIMPSPNTVISQSPQSLPALNPLLHSHPPAIQPAVIPSRSAILPVGQQLSMMSPSAILPSQQTPLVTGGIQGPLYSVSNSTPGYQAISPAIMTVPEPPKTYLLPPNQNLITVPQSQNILNVPQNQLVTPNIPQHLDNYMLSLINNSGIRVSQSLLNTGVSTVMNSTQYVQSVPQVQNITPLQNVPQMIQNMGFQNNAQHELMQKQSTAQTQGPAIKTVPVNSQLQAFVHQSTSSVASNSVSSVNLPPSNPTIVRVFVDGKPIAMTTDASVLNDPTSFLAKLDPTALQRGRYNMSMTSHRVTSTTTVTVSSKGNTTNLKTQCSPTAANKVLSALLKTRTKVVSEPSLHTSLLTKSPRGRPVKCTIPSQKKTIFRQLTKAPTSTCTVSTMASLSSGPSLSTSSMAIQAAPHTRLPPAMAQNRSLLPASFKSQKEDTQSTEKSFPVIKISSTPEMVVNKPYIVRKADGTIVKKIIKTAPKDDQEKNFAIQPKVMKAIMKKLGGDKSLPILGKHGKGYEMLSVRVKSKAAVKVKEKRKRLRKSPQKVRLGLPPPSGTLSHPIIHPHKELMTLPQPALEEEVEETPFGQFQQEQQEKQLGKHKKDGPKFQFQISSDDGFSCKGDSMTEVWQQVIEKVQDLRSSARMKHLSFTSLDPTRLFGISYNPVVYLVEQLFGAQNCRNYNFKYHQYDMADLEEEPAENPSGCIRSEPFESRKPFDIFSFLMSQYRHMPGTCDSKNDVEMVHKSARRATSMDLPMAMRFRKLKEHSREAVGVYRSPIHGRGLFCKRNIDEGEMVIEYAGEVIRASLTDKREKYYEGKGIGCYMFRIDDFDVIDATLHGSAARFINHSCEPNCYSKVINVDGKKHIVIFAMTSIKRGEELTYDYKFPIEEVKIPCTCGAKKCRRYLN
ncbi:histone-lysine N-methyltransferase 2A-like [Saccostrea echinata]|uniref:histone-lysine N-methyltransferase 2A-like n=1 Tax=Saccostrea echinata TaxID=191078 RepID=UPI002A7FAA30|nr:histone-lysine N-methyltransferase 2A-like [Saccostrea echinata]